MYGPFTAERRPEREQPETSPEGRSPTAQKWNSLHMFGASMGTNGANLPRSGAAFSPAFPQPPARSHPELARWPLVLAIWSISTKALSAPAPHRRMIFQRVHIQAWSRGGGRVGCSDDDGRGRAGWGRANERSEGIQNDSVAFQREGPPHPMHLPPRHAKWTGINAVAAGGTRTDVRLISF